jgi:hypothetical protein
MDWEGWVPANDSNNFELGPRNRLLDVRDLYIVNEPNALGHMQHSESK